LAFCDADDVATPGWVSALAEAAAQADLVSGEIELEQLNDPAGQAWERATPLGGVPTTEFAPYPAGGNCGMWGGVAHELAGGDASAGRSSICDRTPPANPRARPREAARDVHLAQAPMPSRARTRRARRLVHTG